MKLERTLIAIALTICVITSNSCGDDSSDNTTAIAALALVASCTSSAVSNSQYSTCSSAAVTEASYTPASDATGRPCSTSISADAPCWIKENFHCVTVTMDGDTIVMTTNNLPPYKSPYYKSPGTYAAYNEATFPSGHSANPNFIASQSITMRIPASPTKANCSYDSTFGSGIDALGIDVHGVVMFNNQAAPGDSLATEYSTFDDSYAHPESTGKYHQHTEPTKITNDDNVLVGIMLDGYPIYGRKSQDGSYPTLDTDTHSVACTTTHFPNGTQCYHVGNGSGVDAYLIGSYFAGRRGTVD
ncbi:MAG: YHYH protein [Leptospiraceae bacterium]|nr:YHYH protein [Leptospiraceae bacterium]